MSVINSFPIQKNSFYKEPLSISKTATISGIIAVITTLFDSLASWYSISHSDVAFEMNGTWNFFQQFIGFEGAMIVRTLWGVFLLWALWECARRLKQVRARAWAVRGLYIVSVVFTLLAAYHILGYMWANGIWPFTY